MKIKLLLGSCLLLLLSGCMTVGYIIEGSVKNAFKDIPNYWDLNIDEYNRGRGYLEYSWTAEPSDKISFEEIPKTRPQYRMPSYPGNEYPNRYLNIFHIKDQNGSIKISHASFDIKTLMQNKSIMYGRLNINYENNLIELKYEEANLNKKLHGSPSNVYYARKPEIILEVQPLKPIESNL